MVLGVEFQALAQDDDGDVSPAQALSAGLQLAQGLGGLKMNLVLQLFPTDVTIARTLAADDDGIVFDCFLVTNMQREVPLGLYRVQSADLELSI